MRIYQGENPAGGSGKSAFQAAVNGGYTGTETEFQNNLANIPSVDKQSLWDACILLKQETATMPGEGFIDWGSICYGGDVYVAVPEWGATVAYSTDGYSWSESALPAKGWWYLVGYGQSRFVAVMMDSNIGAYSEDGRTWTKVTMPFTALWQGGCFCGSFAVPSQSDSDSMVATQGLSPTTPTSTGIFLAFNMDLAGEAPTGWSPIVWSEDGTSWQSTTLSLTDDETVVSVCYGGGLCIALCHDSDSSTEKSYYSSNGIDWTLGCSEIETPYLDCMTCCDWNMDVEFVAYDGGNACAKSSDGITWTEITLPLTTTGGSVRGAIGYHASHGCIIVNRNGESVISDDGTNWEVLSMPEDMRPLAVCADTSRYVCVGDNGNVVLLNNGENWSKTHYVLRDIEGNDITSTVQDLCASNLNFVL